VPAAATPVKSKEVIKIVKITITRKAAAAFPLTKKLNKFVFSIDTSSNGFFVDQ
jgi:hypothetical protein